MAAAVSRPPCVLVGFWVAQTQQWGFHSWATWALPFTNSGQEAAPQPSLTLLSRPTFTLVVSKTWALRAGASCALKSNHCLGASLGYLRRCTLLSRILHRCSCPGIPRLHPRCSSCPLLRMVMPWPGSQVSGTKEQGDTAGLSLWLYPPGALPNTAPSPPASLWGGGWQSPFPYRAREPKDLCQG